MLFVCRNVHNQRHNLSHNRRCNSPWHAWHAHTIGVGLLRMVGWLKKAKQVTITKLIWLNWRLTKPCMARIAFAAGCGATTCTCKGQHTHWGMLLESRDGGQNFVVGSWVGWSPKWLRIVSGTCNYVVLLYSTIL